MHQALCRALLQRLLPHSKRLEPNHAHLALLPALQRSHSHAPTHVMFYSYLLRAHVFRSLHFLCFIHLYFSTFHRGSRLPNKPWIQ